MALTDVTRPVILNTSLIRRTLTPDWIRKVCFVSLGQSKVEIGEIQEVNGSNYLDFMNGSYELEARLKSFFTYSGNNKQCSILELGDQPGVNLENTFENKLKYLREQEDWADTDYYRYVYDNMFSYPQSTQTPNEDSTKMTLDVGNSLVLGFSATQEIKISSNAYKVTCELSAEADKQSNAETYATLDKQEVGDGVAEVVEQSIQITTKEEQGNIFLILKAQKEQEKELQVVIPISIERDAEAEVGEPTDYYAEYLYNYFETNADLIDFWNEDHVFDSPQYRVYYEANRLENNPATLKQYLDTQGIDGWRESYYNYLANNVEAFKNFLDLGSLSAFCGTLDWYNGDYYSRWLIDNGTFSTDYSEKINNLAYFIKNGKNRQYIFVLNEQINTSSYLKTLLNQFSGINDAVYFFVDFRLNDFILPDDELPAYAFNLKQWNTNTPQDKSAVMFIDNGKNKEFTLASAVAGLFASNMFDISLNNPCSPFNYKTLAGFEFDELPRINKADFIDKSFNFIDEIAGQRTFLNGRCKDTYPLDFWYQWDYLALNLDTSLKNLILNGANNPLYAIRYNQTGIDTIKASLLSTLNNAKSLGLIDSFCESLNPATGEMVNFDSIVCIPFAEYIATNPDDYQNEIYGGASFVVRIGRYIRQLIIQVNLV